MTTSAAQSRAPAKTNWLVDRKALEWKPLLPDQFVPFLQAMVLVGRKTFGDEWGDAEQHAQLVAPPIPDALKTWTGVVSAQRVEAAIDTLVRDILNKRVRTYGWVRDSAVHPELLDPVLFSRTWVPQTLRSGRMSIEDVNHMVFIDADDLADRYAAPAEAPAINGVDVEALSPYLRLAIDVVMKSGVSETNAPTVQSLMADLEHNAKRFGLEWGSTPDDTLSPSLAKAIAKAMRWPAARVKTSKG